MSSSVASRFVPVATLAVLVAGISATQAAEILFAFVGPNHYVADGNNLADMVDELPEHNITRRFLTSAVYTDYASFDQIWVYDLNAMVDMSAIQMANYQGIADWYNNRDDQNIILDGRIISSSDSWTSAWSRPSESPLVQSYAGALDARGGGLMLGTDHAPSFTSGINEINQLIGIGDFTGFYYSPPYAATIDVASPLYVDGLGFSCGAGITCINDNSSTSFVPTGLQANGQFLTPLAYHGTFSQAYSNAAIASNIGSITFGTEAVPEPGTYALMGLGLLALAGMRKRLKK